VGDSPAADVLLVPNGKMSQMPMRLEMTIAGMRMESI